MPAQRALQTKILPVDTSKIGRVTPSGQTDDLLDDIDFDLDSGSSDAQHILRAAEQLKFSSVPVAFPTETVYGLGADATSTDAVKGIYNAKQRPADNPLIVHVASLAQLRSLLRPAQPTTTSHQIATNGERDQVTADPIPEIYRPLVSKFWPGPLTIIVPNPTQSKLAPEVTAGLTTFGARMPRHLIALALIKLADRPIAAPSANASTKPSPTAAEHVAYDLDGRIETILDGGPCEVGVESTVVDGLCDPPLILRPGGISLEQIRACTGWGGTQIGYKDSSEKESKPKAPGMKYRHYSPRARVVLHEAGSPAPGLEELLVRGKVGGKIGLVRTKTWKLSSEHDFEITKIRSSSNKGEDGSVAPQTSASKCGFAAMLDSLRSQETYKAQIVERQVKHDGVTLGVLDLNLGTDTADIARGIFSALRDLDRQNVDAIFVEGISDDEGDVAAAVMNRLRKAAEVNITSSGE